MEDLQQSIARLKPLADQVVDAATALNAAIRAAAQQGLTVRVDVLEESVPNDEPTPQVRARISKRIV